MKKSLLTLLALPLACASLSAQNSGAIWSQTIERALGAHGIEAAAVADIKNGEETLNLTIDGKTVCEPVRATGAVSDYSSTVYVIIDGIESRMRYMGPVVGTINQQMRPAANTSRASRQSVPVRMTPGQINYDPAREWHSRSSSYKPDDVFEDLRDLDLLEVLLEESIGRAYRVKLIDPAYVSSIPAEEKLYLLRVRVIDLQRGLVFEKPAEGQPAPPQPKISKKLAYANVSIQLVDDTDGHVAWQGNIDDNDYTGSMSTDPMENVLKTIGGRLTRVLDELFPHVAPRPSAEGVVTAVASEKKEKVTAVYVDMGTDQMLKSGDSLVIYLQKNVGGNIGITQIGTASVSEVQGPTLSLCKIKKGEKDIYSALQAGDVLVVKTSW